MTLRLKTILAAALVLSPAMAARAEVVDVLARPVTRGEILAPSDFKMEDVPGTRARDVLDMGIAVGMEAARNLRAGYSVRSHDVVQPRLVRRGEQVGIILRNGALTIGASGRALDDGAEGERVRVFSETTNRTLEGTVEADGRVRVLPG